jgi:hypothetical protein
LRHPSNIKTPSVLTVVLAALTTSSPLGFAQTQATTSIPYCAELKELNNYAMSQGRFASIIGQPREGNYREAKLTLPSWKNCAFYGNATYTCNSAKLASAAGSTDQDYGQIEFAYGSRSDITRSTSPREILPLLYALAGRQPPAPIAGADYPGYPHVADAEPVLVWFLGGLPLLIMVAWWWSRRPPRLTRIPVLKEVQP